MPTLKEYVNGSWVTKSSSFPVDISRAERIATGTFTGYASVNVGFQPDLVVLRFSDYPYYIENGVTTNASFSFDLRDASSGQNEQWFGEYPDQYTACYLTVNKTSVGFSLVSGWYASTWQPVSTEEATYEYTAIKLHPEASDYSSVQKATGSFSGTGYASGSSQYCGFKPDIVIVQPPDSYYEGQTQYPNAFMFDFRELNLSRTVTGASFIGTLGASDYRGIGGYGTLQSNGWLPSYFYEDDYSGSSTAITYPTNRTYTWTAYKFGEE